MTPYADRAYAATYFATRLHSGSWNTFPPAERDAALVTATRQIDRLNLVGEKNASYLVRSSITGNVTDEQELAIMEAGMTQELQFPRGSDTVVPDDIKIACCEIAFELIHGKNAQTERENLATVSQGFAAVRKTMDRSYNQEHLLAGIVSAEAWDYLRPYLRESNTFRISRVS